jgi:dihydrofolate reductase
MHYFLSHAGRNLAARLFAAPQTKWCVDSSTRDCYAVRKLKQQDGRDLLMFGHGLLAETLLKEKLVDVIDLSIHPVVVGHGKLFFREGETPN